MKENATISDLPAGIYIHVPFCKAKCPYCDFYSIPRLGQIPDYLRALDREIGLYRGQIAFADTIYFGGGTPSLLAADQIQRILDTLFSTFTFAHDVEITLEANPGTITRQDLDGYRVAGVNRLNLGLQSIDDARLRFLGRIHTARQGREAYRLARDAGFDNVGLDLIYGLPGQTLGQWAPELEAVADFQAEHLSCYTLTLEEGTPLAVDVEKGRVDAPDEARVGELFAHTVKWLNHHGYRQYEISNFARVNGGDGPDRRSRHNRKYWLFAPYLGFGPSAHSFANGRRWWNRQDLDRYLADLDAGQTPVADAETLTHEQQMIEFIYLGLRQTDGIDTVEYQRRFGGDFFKRYGDRAQTLVQEGWLNQHRGQLRLTRRGMRLLESVVDRLLL